jgi:hypothetical protein
MIHSVYGFHVLCFIIEWEEISLGYKFLMFLLIVIRSLGKKEEFFWLVRVIMRLFLYLIYELMVVLML